MKIEKFEDILSWQKSIKLALDSYNLFKINKDFGYKDQLLRAVISISNNIAEGFEKGTDKDFRKFLFISKGSCAEFRSMLYIGKSVGYITQEEFQDFYNRSVEISRLIGGLIKSLKVSE